MGLGRWINPWLTFQEQEILGKLMVDDVKSMSGRCASYRQLGCVLAVRHQVPPGDSWGFCGTGIRILVDNFCCQDQAGLLSETRCGLSTS